MDLPANNANPQLNMNEEELYKQISDPKFDLSQVSYETEVGLVANIFNRQEQYQRAIGRIALHLTRQSKWGDNILKKFMQDVEQLTGKKRAASTLRAYRVVYERLESFIHEIPEDLPFTALRWLSASDDPYKWFKKAMSEGWSGSELVRQLRLAKGDKPGEVICSKCYAVQPNKGVCWSCHEPLI